MSIEAHLFYVKSPSAFNFDIVALFEVFVKKKFW